MKSITRILRQIATNSVYKTAWYQNRRRKKTIGETGSQQLSPKDAARLTWEIFEKYCLEAGWLPEDINGKWVLEIGPGELFGVPLLFALYGAVYSAGIDKFEEFRDTERTRAIIQNLRLVVPETALTFWDEYVDSGGRIKLDIPGLHYIHGREFEKIALPPRFFDLICSHTVLEHIMDMDACFAQQAALLNTDGQAVHQVDFRSHDGDEKYSLEFLEYPEFLWRLMTDKMDGPNRLRMSDYKNTARQFGFKITGMSTTSNVPSDIVEMSRPRLNGRFGTRSYQDLAAQGILFSMCKTDIMKDIPIDPRYGDNPKGVEVPAHLRNPRVEVTDEDRQYTRVSVFLSILLIGLLAGVAALWVHLSHVATGQ